MFGLYLSASPCLPGNERCTVNLRVLPMSKPISPLWNLALVLGAITNLTFELLQHIDIKMSSPLKSGVDLEA